MNKNILTIFFAFALVFLSGCSLLGELLSYGCIFSGDSPHCYQAVAIQKGDSSTCEKVKQPTQFKDVNSNPPKDKCFMTVALNKDEPSICKKIEGGMYSYTQEECAQPIIDDLQTQVQSLVAPSLNELQNQVEEELTKKELTPKDIAQINENMKKIQEAQQLMTTLQKSIYASQKTAIMNLR